MMAVAAARLLRNRSTCFVGIGIPSLAANLARRTHAPELVLIYESGCIDAKPATLPLSIGDGELSETALATVSVPEIFNYWLQRGVIDVGFLGAAQIDRFGNINSTFIGGDYHHPKVRLPGGGGAPEIAGSCRQVMIVMRQSLRAFVPELDFVTSVGYGTGAGYRERMGLLGAGPRVVITDLGILTPHPQTRELQLSQLHPGLGVDEVVAATGWPLAIADDLCATPPPTDAELEVLGRLHASASG